MDIYRANVEHDYSVFQRTDGDSLNVSQINVVFREERLGV